VTLRPFRFGLQVAGAPSRAAWIERGRKAEDLGFDVFLVPDHVGDGLLAPMVALGAIAEATTTLGIGTLVLNNDFRNPGLVAREASTLGLISAGRFELGIGAGHAEPEYRTLGIPFDPAPRRVDRLESAVRLLREEFDGTILVGGNGDRVLTLAATTADVVGFTGAGRTRVDGQTHEVEWRVGDIDAKVDVVRRAAGARSSTLELNVLVQHIEVTGDRRAVLDAMAPRVGVDPQVLGSTPYVLVGTVDEIVAQLHTARDRWGFSYFVTRDADATASIIAALR
jgi:probable F420-dependent oxidoreductase